MVKACGVCSVAKRPTATRRWCLRAMFVESLTNSPNPCQHPNSCHLLSQTRHQAWSSKSTRKLFADRSNRKLLARRRLKYKGGGRSSRSVSPHHTASLSLTSSLLFTNSPILTHSLSSLLCIFHSFSQFRSRYCIYEGVNTETTNTQTSHIHVLPLTQPPLPCFPLIDPLPF